MRAASTLLFLCAALAGCGGPPAPPPPPPVPVFTAQAGYPRVSAEIIAWLLERDPAQATAAGEHAHDTTLGSWFAGDLERAARDARALLTRLQGVNRATLERPDYFDHRVLEYALRAELLELESLGTWQRDPMRYVDAVARGTIALLEPGLGLEPQGTVQSLAARWNDVPLVFRAARQNLEPARVSSLGARQAAQRAADLAAWFDGPQVAAWRNTIVAEPGAARAMATAQASIDSFQAWSADLAPRSTGGFHIGSEALRQLLLYRHHLDMPLAEIEAVNRRALVDYREWLERVARDLDPLRQPGAIVDSIVSERPDGWQLLPPIMQLGGSGDAPRRARRVAAPAGLREAWTHYIDLASIESEAAPKVERIAALHRALHAHALLGAVLQLHAGSASLEEVALRLERQAFLPREAARFEAERIATDPAYAFVALDRMQIMALRERLRAARGGAFSEEAFAQELLDLALPVPLAAEALLGREPGRLLDPAARTPGVPEPPRLLD